MTAQADKRAPIDIPVAAPASWTWILDWIAAAMDRRAQRARLATLPPRLLRDIGLTAAQAEAEARRPWWQG